MIPFYLSELALISHGLLIGENIKINKISFDTRKLIIGSLFIALKGKNFNALNFINEATNKGASSFLVDQPISTKLPYIIVNNVLLAIGLLGKLIRRKSNVISLAITGSSGKTTVKEMTASILKNYDKTLYTYKNFNNNIGVPLTLINLKKKHKYLVVEIGANNLKEINYSTKLIKPHVALVNNISASHLLGFKSIQGVANAKGEIFNGLIKKGTAIINHDSNDIINWKNKLNQKKILFYSKNKNLNSDIYASNICLNKENTTFYLHFFKKKTKITINLLGMHNVFNALAASALAMSIEIPIYFIKLGLFNTKNIKGRLSPIKINNNQIIIDDSYNANYLSVISSIKFLKTMPGYLVMVIGDILELGDQENYYYEKIIKFINLVKLNKIISFGCLSKKISNKHHFGEHFNNRNDLVEKLLFLMKKHKKITILVKGSRLMAMNKIVNMLKEKINVHII